MKHDTLRVRRNCADTIIKYGNGVYIHKENFNFKRGYCFITSATTEAEKDGKTYDYINFTFDPDYKLIDPNDINYESIIQPCNYPAKTEKELDEYFLICDYRRDKKTYEDRLVLLKKLYKANNQKSEESDNKILNFIDLLYLQIDKENKHIEEEEQRFNNTKEGELVES